MNLQKVCHTTACFLSAVVFIVSPMGAGGFAVFDQGAAAAGMADAATAQSTSADTLFYNIAGAAFFKETAQAAGVLYRATQNLALETQPDIGNVATSVRQDDPLPALVHAYTVHPLRENLKLGVAVYSPFDLDTGYSNPDTFPARMISLGSEIRTLDSSFSLATRIGQRFAIGLGAVVRVSTLSTLRRLQVVDPSSGLPIDYGSLDLESDPQAGLGWNLGLMFKGTDMVSFGASYRSRVAIDYSGTGSLTQIPTGDQQLDELLRLTNPFGQDLPMRSRIDFPDVASLGVAFHPNPRFLVEMDVNWTGWKSIRNVNLSVLGFPIFDETLALDFEDTLTYRVGAQYSLPSGAQWRFGYAFDESPVDSEAPLNPFLMDADRDIFSFGFGRDWLQVAVQWISYHSRSTQSEELAGVFFGDAWQFTLTLRHKKRVRRSSGPKITELLPPTPKD